MAKKRKGKSSFLTGPLDKKTFKKEMRAAIRQEFGAVQRDLQKERRISRKTQRRNADYFSNYQDQLGQLQQQSQQGTQNALNQMGQYGQQILGGNMANFQALQQQQQQNATSRGATPGAQVTGNPQLFNQAVGAAGQIAGAGQLQSDYLGDVKLAAEKEKNAMRQQQQLVRRTVREELRQLKKDKGAAKQTFKTEAREGERRYDLATRQLRQSKMQLKRGRISDNKQRKYQREADRKAAKLEKWKTKHGPSGGKGGEGGARKATGWLRSNLPPKDLKSIKRGEVGKKRTYTTLVDKLIGEGYSREVAKATAHRFIKRYYDSDPASQNDNAPRGGGARGSGNSSVPPKPKKKKK